MLFVLIYIGRKIRKLVMGIDGINSVNRNYMRPVAFTSNEQEKPAEVEVKEDKEMSSATKWMIGATALAGVVALGFAGRYGHLGAGIQKFLGGVAKESDSVADGGAAVAKFNLLKSSKDDTIKALKAKGYNPVVTENPDSLERYIVKYTTKRGKEVSLTYPNGGTYLYKIESVNKDVKRTLKAGLDSKLLQTKTEAIADNTVIRDIRYGYDDGINKVYELKGLPFKDVTASFRPDKAKHVRLTAEKAKKVIEGFGENAKLAYTPTDDAMTYTNKLGKKIKLAFDDAGNFLNAKTIVKTPISE